MVKSASVGAATRSAKSRRPEAKKAAKAKPAARASRSGRQTVAAVVHRGRGGTRARTARKAPPKSLKASQAPHRSRKPNAEEAAEVRETGEGGDAEGTDVELTQQYIRWFDAPEQAAFLAYTEYQLLRACCRVLPYLTVRPSSSAAFLAVATHGVTPPSSPTTGGGESAGSQGFPPADRKDAAKKPWNATATTTSPSSPLEDARPLSSDHEEVYRTVRSTIAASCALGHRSCQAVWGPRGSGKHRVVRLVAEDCRRQPNTLVLQLDGRLLDSDEAAIRCIAKQMLDFVLSPQSAALRAADGSVRTGTFDFGRLFHFDSAMEKAGVALVDIDDDEEEEEDEEECEGPFITTTSGNLVGGAASALPPLQRALLLMRRRMVNLVFCINHAERFGIWCDQLLYVLAGLMHESDGQGGGMSLLLTSASPDLRHMEKRLSSRLTGETRFVPLLPWTPRRMLRAVLAVVREACECRVALVEAAAEAAAVGARGRKRKAHGPSSVHGRGNERRQSPLSTLAPEWQGRVSALAQLLPPAYTVLSDEAAALDEPLSSLGAHPTLTLEATAALCHDLQQQLNVIAYRADRRKGGGYVASAGPSSLHAQTLIRRIQELNEDLTSTGGTAEAAMTAVVSCLCKAAAGALDALGAKGRHRALRWLDQRQGREPTWPWASPRAGGEAVGARPTPTLVKQRWLATATATAEPSALPPSTESGLPGVTAAAGAPSLHVGVTAPLPPDLLDLLEGGKLVQLGYASREAIQVLFHMFLRAESGIRSRSIADLLEDVTSALGTRAAAALDTESYRLAVQQLCRWRLLKVSEDGEVVSLCGSASRLRELLRTVLEHRVDWCESGVLGLDAKDYMRMRSLV